MSSAAALTATSPSPSTVATAHRATARPELDPDRLDSAGEQSLSFSDFLSIINPLQHIPIVGSIYRAITGDTIAPAPKVIGGILFGGPMGLITSAFGAVIEQVTGKDVGEHALALFTPSSDEPPADTAQYAAAASGSQSAPQQAQTSTTTETDSAPLSRALLGAGPATDPVTALTGATPATTASGAARGLTHRASVGATTAANGRTLADYWASAGHPMPVIDNARSGNVSAPVRLNTTLPAHERATTARPASDRAAPEALPGSKDDAAATDEAATDPFVAAMMRGLDRYREMKQSQMRSAPSVIDATL